jgi:hypothetical protein
MVRDHAVFIYTKLNFFIVEPDSQNR